MVDYFIYKLKKGELTGGGPRKKSNEAVFVAHSFNTEGNDFRIKLEQEIKRIPSLSKIDVLDGRVPIGKSWPTEIRERLRKSRVIIADLTVLSSEVLFECGFAWGLGKPILPVTRKVDSHGLMPRWLTDLQIGNLSFDKGWNDLINSLGHHISEIHKKRRKAPSDSANPSSVVILKSNSSLSLIEDQVRQMAMRFGMEVQYEDTLFDTLEGTTSELVAQVAHCSLLVAPLLNQLSDSFVHFACGVVGSVPKTGVSKRKLSRRILLVVNSVNETECLPADSARRMSGVIRIITPQQLCQELTKYGQLFTTWQKRQRD